MGTENRFTFVIDIYDEEITVANIDPDYYSRVVMIDEVKKVADMHGVIVDERYNLQAKLPWTGGVFDVCTDGDLLKLFEMMVARNVFTMRFNLEILPMTTLLPVHTLPTMPPHDEAGPSNPQNSDRPQAVEFEVEDEFHWSDDDEENIEEPVTVTGEDENGDSLYDWEGSGAEVEGNASSEDDPAVTRMSKHMVGEEFKKELVNGKMKVVFKVGQVFQNVEQFRLILQEYIIQEGVSVKKVKNEPKRVTLKCKNRDCGWYLHAATLGGSESFKLKRYSKNHTYGKRLTKNKEASTKWIAREYGAILKNAVGGGIKPIQEMIFSKHQVWVPKYNLYRARNKFLESEGLDHTNSFQLIRKYAHIVLQTNPRSIFLLQVSETDDQIREPPRFKNFMLSFVGQKDGFLHGSRKFIGIDGCFLKGYYGGQLLSAVSIDANNGLYPVAICIYEVESSDSWGWFLSRLKEFLGVANEHEVTFMSDRQKGVINTLEKYWPLSKVRFCCRHIYANFRQKWPGLFFRKLFWDACKATNRADFDRAVKEIKRLDEAAYNYLISIDDIHWSRHRFDTTIKSDHFTNNMTEAFNSWLGDNRSLPLVSLLEQYRRRIMKRIQKRGNVAKDWVTPVPPMVYNKINQNLVESKNLRIIWPGTEVHEIMDETATPRRTYLVNLKTKECDCGAWQLTGYPFSHGVCALSFQRLYPNNIAEYVDNILSIQKYLETYSHLIAPIPDLCMWDVVDEGKVLPPVRKAKMGRPKTSRKREESEKAKESRTFTLKCGHCKEYGHNKRTCHKLSANANKAPGNKKKKTGSSTSQRPFEEATVSQNTAPTQGSHHKGQQEASNKDGE